jgi:hypothetical protein
MLDAAMDEAFAGIADGRHSGVCQVGHAESLFANPGEELLRFAGFVVFVETDQWFADLIAGQEPLGVAGIFARNGIDLAQAIEGAEGDVREVSDGPRHQIEPGGKGRGRAGTDG